jgi:arabinofuranan 3-O-arabinosyltransferase
MAAETASVTVPATSPSREETPAAERSDRFVWGVRHVVVCLLLSGFAMASDPGRMVADTKLDLVVDPVGFLVRGLRLWDPMGAAGQLQNQAYGYLFPMGPFFAAGKVLGVPEWVVQRAWWALVLCTAYIGIVVLARRLGVGSQVARMVGGVAFAVSPHVLTVLGPVSAEAWPMALSPWVLVPLAGVGATGSIRRAAFRSGLAVFFMGGVNAVLTLAALLPAVLWLATRRLGVRTLRLVGAWLLAVVLATLWWVVPLLLLGRYSPPFLDYIESASVTTSTTSLVEAVRGTHDWVAYLPGAGWSAGSLLLTSPVLVLTTVLVAAGGLAGLAAVRTPHRPWLLACLLVGLAGVTLGHVAPVDGFAAGSVQALLDGPLAPLRNTHKFDVAVRLPLCLGLALLVDRIRWGNTGVERRATRALVAAAAVFAVVGTGVPLITMRLAPAGSFVEIPGYWHQAAAWLGAQQPQGRALLVPGSRFAVYDWGTTNDEPIQALAQAPWDVRSAVPLTDPGHIRWLDSVEADLAAGQGGPALGWSLARAGVTNLVVRNDLDAGTVGATRAVRVHQALEESPGISRVASFGPDTGSDGVPTLVYDQHLRIPYPAVEVYAVDRADDPRVSLAPLSAVRRLVGGPEALTSLLADPALRARPTVAAGAGAVPEGPPTVLTDTPRRREASFAAGGDGYSQTLTQADPLRLPKTRRDYATPGTPDAVARTLGGWVTASSSASDAGVLGGSDPSAMPFSAVDGDRETAWRPNPAAGAAGSWLQVDYDHEVDLAAPTLTFLPGSKVARVTVFSGGADATTAVRGATRVTLRTPHIRGRDLRVRIDALLPGADPQTLAGIAELTVRGGAIQRTVDLPDLPRQAASTAPEVIALTTSGRRDACAFVGERPLCAAGQTRLGEDAAGLDRSLTLPAAADYVVSASVVPRAGPALDKLIATATTPRTTVTASSDAVPDPSGSARSAADGDLGTAWVAAPDDPDPTLTLSWSRTQEVRSLKIVLDRYAAGTRPTDVAVTANGRTQLAVVAADGTVRLEATEARSLVLHLRARRLASSYDPGTRELTHLGIGVSEVLVPGVHDLASPGDLDAERQRPVSLECGQTPSVVVDGIRHRTAATVTVGQLRRMEPVSLTFCDGTTLALGRGGHRVRLPSDLLWTPGGVQLSRADASPAAASAPDVTVASWGVVGREVRLPARTEPTLLTVHENANAGWRATFAGRPLEHVTVDGWQQGYLVPPGDGGVVRLAFTPDEGMGLGLLVSGVALVALWLGALLPPRRRQLTEIRAREPVGPGLAVLGAVALAAVGGAWGLAMGLVGAGLVWAMRRWGPPEGVLPAVLAATAYAVAGVLLALAPWGSPGYAADDVATQLLCLLAIGVVVAGVASSGRERTPLG